MAMSSIGSDYNTLATQGPTTQGTAKTEGEQKSESALKGLGSNFETFLRLLTTQMQNQDPLKPMDTNDMTRQLVEFANVEQNIGTNSRLDKLLKLQGSATATTNLSYLGRIICYEGDQFDYSTGMQIAPLSYELESEAKSVRVNILNAQGEIVRSFDGEKTAGVKHEVNWDFKDNNGATVPPGSYRLSIVPKGEKDDDVIKASTQTFGLVTGIGYTKDGETTLSVGRDQVPLSDISMVY